jgi:hypothetical protein
MNLPQYIEEKRQLGELICSRLNAEIAKLGFALGEISHSVEYEKAQFELVKDPYTGQVNLSGCWRSDDGRQRIGRLQFNSDDSFYAEYDVVKPHPTKSAFFVEAVTAWGNAELIKAEAKLLSL